MTKKARKSKHFEAALKAVEDMGRPEEPEIFDLEDRINRMVWGHDALTSLLNGCGGSADSVVWVVDRLRGEARALQAKYAGIIRKSVKKKR